MQEQAARGKMRTLRSDFTAGRCQCGGRADTLVTQHRRETWYCARHVPDAVREQRLRDTVLARVNQLAPPVLTDAQAGRAIALSWRRTSGRCSTWSRLRPIHNAAISMCAPVAPGEPWRASDRRQGGGKSLQGYVAKPAWQVANVLATPERSCNT